jgi:hypothetical protein
LVTGASCPCSGMILHCLMFLFFWHPMLRPPPSHTHILCIIVPTATSPAVPPTPQA